MLLAGLCTILEMVYFFAIELFGMKLRASCSALVYRKVISRSLFCETNYDLYRFKVLKVSHETISKRTAGHMVNLLSTDAEKLTMFVQYLCFILAGPLQVAIVAWLCYEKIGIPALIGLTNLVVQLPIQGYLYNGR